MLLMMLPEQVSNQWETIRPAIEASLPAGIEVTEEYMTNILQSILRGNMQCWILVNGVEVCAIGVTAIFSDPGGCLNLFIYSLYGYKPAPLHLWSDAIDTLKKWANAKGCTEIVAYSDSDNKFVIMLAERLGGDISRVLVRIPISKNGGL